MVGCSFVPMQKAGNEALAEAICLYDKKINVDEAGSLSSKYGIRNIPTLLFIKNGEVVDKHVGAASKKEISEKLNSLI